MNTQTDNVNTAFFLTMLLGVVHHTLLCLYHFVHPYKLCCLQSRDVVLHFNLCCVISLVREVFFPDGIKGMQTTFSLALKAVRSRKGRQYTAVARCNSILLSVSHTVLRAAARARYS